MPTHPDIYVTIDESVSESEIRLLADDLAESLGPDRLLDFIGTGGILRERTADYPLLPDTLPKVACVLRVHLCTPYYGKGYERGYWPEIAATLEFLRRRVRRAQVWYGPDGTEMVYEVTGAFLDGVWDYWATHGGRPYHSGARQAPS